MCVCVWGGGGGGGVSNRSGPESGTRSLGKFKEWTNKRG